MNKVIKFRGRRRKLLMEPQPQRIWGKREKATKAQVAAAKWRKDLTTNLTFHGREDCIKGNTLAELYGKSKSYLIKIIQRLVLEDGQAIGSGPNGYFWIVTPADREEAVRILKLRGIKTLRRAARLEERHIQDVFNEAWKAEYERLAGEGLYDFTMQKKRKTA